MSLPAPPVLAARLRHRAARVSWPGLTGIALTLAATALVAADLLWVRPRNDELRNHVGSLGEELARARSRPVPAPVLDPEQRLLTHLPRADSITAFLEFIHAEAARHDIVVDSADYRTEAPLAGKALRYRVSLPVHANYVQLRTWIDQVLAQHGSASLDELAIQRDADGSAALKGRVQLSYFTQSAR